MAVVFGEAAVFGAFEGAGEEDAGFVLDDEVGGAIVAGGDEGVAFYGIGEVLAGEDLVDDVAVGLDEGGGGAGGLGSIVEAVAGDIRVRWLADGEADAA